MPEGVAVVVDGDGFATIDFIDPATRGPGLDALNKTGCAEFIEKDTRSGSRVLYRAPEGNVRAAGLLDEVSQVEALEMPDTSSATDATGGSPPEPPSATELYAQTVRTGAYATEGAPVVDVVEPVAADEVPPAEPTDHTGATAEDGALPTGDFAPADPAVDVVEPPASGKGYDDGKPDSDWSRPQLNAYAEKLGLDPKAYSNAAKILAAIREKEAEKSA